MDKNCATSSRAMRMVQLVLKNKELSKKITAFKKKVINKRAVEEQISDPDFEVPSSPNVSSSETESEEDPGHKTHSINILQNTIVRPANAVIQSDINNSLSGDVTGFISELLGSIINDAVEHSINKQSNLYTKTGQLRKRRKFSISLENRKRQKLENKKVKHSLKVACGTTCKKRCTQKILEDHRAAINSNFWEMTDYEQKNFIINMTGRTATKRKTSLYSRRSMSNTYRMKDANGVIQEVCKVFFLATLGYPPSNDRIIRSALSRSDASQLQAAKSQKGRSAPSNKIDRTVIKQHIESFNPTISHYRREHAPNRRYLPSDITITSMFNDFKQKYPNMQFSYYLYREVVSKMNISFAALGHEECFACEKFKNHHKSNNIDHDFNNLQNDCQECVSWKIHNEKVKLARQHYQTDAEASNNSNTLVCSADLQKVIMLPRCEMFKEVIFVPRIIAFNESIVPLGKKQKKYPTAIVWHEALSGRSKEDIISAFYAFFLDNRDIEHITLWLDNCAAQNKNWTLLSFCVFIVNTEEVALKRLTLKYFEPGHTFMSADAFHHQVEQSLKRMKKVYDFEDFKDAVQNANSSKVKLISLKLNKFFKWEDKTSQFKLRKINPRPYLNDMVQIDFEREKYTLFYKTQFDQENSIELNFWQAKYLKTGAVAKPKCKTECRGVSRDRKEALINKLEAIIPTTRMQFWNELPVSANPADIEDND